MSQPFFSVLICVYNGQHFVRRCLLSVQNQSFKDFEIIIVDDGSQDGTLEEIQAVVSEFKDLKVKVFRQRNQGLTSALNLGLSHAVGIWCARLDIDDEWTDDHLSAGYDQISNDMNSSLVYVGANSFIVSKSGEITRSVLPKTTYVLKFFLYTWFKFFAHSGSIFKLNVDGHNIRYDPMIKKSQDLDLWLRLSQLGKFANTGKTTVRVYQHCNQITRVNSSEQIQFALFAHRKFWNLKCDSKNIEMCSKKLVQLSQNRNGLIQKIRFAIGKISAIFLGVSI